MFYKKMSRFFSSLLIVLLCCSIFASAAYQRASSRIALAIASLEKESNGDLSITCCIEATKVMDEIGVSSIRIDRSNGSGWIRECAITENDFPRLSVTGLSSHDIQVPYSPQYSNVRYRAVVAFYAKDSEGKSTKNVTTNSI